MRVIKRPTIRDFYARHPDSEKELEAWYYEAKRANWSNPAEIKAKYGSASILKGGGRVVFNICGNKYRLVVQIAYKPGIVYIRFLGTHDEYDQITAETI